MKVAIKPYTPFFILIFAAAVIAIGFSTYKLPSKMSTKQLPVVSTAHVDSQTNDNQQQSPEKQTITDLKDEIVSLKAEIKHINQTLTQLTTNTNQHENDSNAETILSAEELQAIESTQDDYETINEMNRVQSVDIIDDYFLQLPSDAFTDSKKEAAIKQSLSFDQNDMASILDVHCKTSLCRVEVKYNLSENYADSVLDENQHAGFSTTLSSLLDTAVRQEINEVDQTAVAVIFLGQAEVDLSLNQ